MFFQCLRGQEHTDALNRAAAYKATGDSLLRASALLAADSILTKALAVYDSIKIRDLGLANVYHALAYTSHNLSLIENSISYLKESIDIKESIYDQPDHPDLVLDYILYGDILSSQNREHEAIDHLEFALRISLSLPFKQQSSTDMIMGRLSDSYMQIEDFEKSLLMKERVLEFRKKKYGTNSFWVGEALYRLGTHYRFIKEYAKAAEFSRQAEEMIADQGSPYDQRALPLVRVYLGINLMHTGSMEEGWQYITRGITKLEKTMAQLVYQRVILYENVALAYFETDQADSALHYFQKAIDLNTSNGAVRDIYENPPVRQITDMREVHPSFVGKSRALEVLYEESEDKNLLKAAYYTILKADSLGDRLRAEPTIFRDKVQYQGMMSKSNGTGFQLSYELYKTTDDLKYLEQAFRFSEKNKASLLLANLQEAVHLKNARVPDTIIMQSEQYTEEITKVEWALYELNAEKTRDSAVIATYQNKLLRLREDQENLFKEIKEAYPNYYQARYGENAVDMASIQRLLKKGELLLNYHLSDENLYVFQISRNESDLRVVTIDNTLAQTLEDYLEVHAVPAVSNEAYRVFVETSKKLREILLPKQEVLAQYERITIVPDGDISTIPFGTLITADSRQTSGFDQPLYLIKTHEISYASSAGLLLRLRNSKSVFSEASVLAFAPIFEEGQVAQFRGIDSVRSELGSLSWTQEEVKNIEKNFDTRAFLGKTATEGRFKQESAGFAVVHVASHGLLDETDPLFSKLVFTRQDRDSINDGYLTTREIFNMNIPAEMVVLSACNTGKGETASGEGVLSLASGFFYAGSQSLVMTLWTANDQSTTKIMDRFYQSLSQGKSKSAALRNAKLSYLEEAEGLLAHPYYWAHFVVNGDERPIIKTGFPWYYLGAILLLSMALGAALLRKRSRS